MGTLCTKLKGATKNTKVIYEETTANDLPEAKGKEPVNEKHQITYNKKSGTAGMSGQLYEIYTAMYFLLQGKKLCEENKINDFHLATNMQEAGNLDDVVFRCSYIDQTGAERTKLMFIQAKHRDNPQKSILTLEKILSEDCSKSGWLDTYFTAYKKIKNCFTELKTDPIFGCNFEECELIFFTNATCSLSESDTNVEKLKLPQDDMLNIGKDNYYYKLKLGGNNDIRIVHCLNNSYSYKILAKHLAECLHSDECADEDITMNFYFNKLSKEVIENTEKGKAKFRESFLNEKDNTFRRMLLEEIRNKEEFSGLPEGDLISILAEKNFNLPKNFCSLKAKNSREIEDFLRRFKIFVNQPNERDLREIIMKEIQTKFALEKSDVEIVFLQVKSEVENWWRHENYFLTESNTYYEESARVSIWFDVRDPVEMFTGRQGDLRKLHEILQRNQGDDKMTVISQITSISGLGGIGKSELARKYIQVYSESYENNIMWINAENYETICESFRRLAQSKLRICTETMEGKPREIQSIVREVFFFFTKRKCLFVFDNAEKYRSERDGDEGIATFIPSLPQNSERPYILITSRNHEWGNIEVLSLGTFTEKEAGELIRKALNLEDSEEPEVKMLAETLQYFPLALQQAVAYIRETNKILQIMGSKFSIINYMDRYEQESEKLLSYNFPDDSSDLYTRTTFTTWTITTDKIQENFEYGEEAILILRIIAYLYGKSIPAEIFRENGQSEVNDERVGNILRILMQHSLIDIKDGFVNVHKLVQKVTQINTRNEEKELLITLKAFHLLKRSALSCDDSVAKIERLVPHLEAFLAHTDDMIPRDSYAEDNIQQFYVRNLLVELGWMYNIIGKPKRQNQLLRRLLEIQEKDYGADHFQVANTLVNLGNTYREMGEPLEAKKLLERALEIQENHYGADHLIVATTLVNLGNAVIDTLETLEGKKLLERALEIQEKHYDDEHFEIATTLGSLGCAYGALGEPLEATKLLERALEIREKHYGADHLIVATTLVNLSNAYRDMHETLEQDKLIERVLEIREKHYGDDHFKVAPTLVNLDNVCGYMGEPLERKKLLERTLEIQEKHYGADHFQVATTLVNLGNVYGDMGKPLEAKELLERALEIREKHYGADHFQVATTLWDLSKLYADMGEPLEEMKVLERALEIEEKHYGADHFQVANTLGNLGNAYRDMGEPLEAKKLFERALEIEEKHYGADHFQVANTLGNLGCAYGDMGEFLEAKKLLEKALEIHEKHYGAEHFKVAYTLVNLSNAYRCMGEPLKAKKLLERALEINEKHYGADHFQVANTLGNLGNAYRDMGEPLEAEKLFERALEIEEKYYGADHFQVATTLMNLGYAYEDMGELLEARKLLDRAMEIQEKHYGADHFQLAITLVDLGNDCGDLGDPQERDKLLESAFETEEKH